MTGYEEDPETGIVELVVDGKVTKEDFERLSGRLEAFIEKQGKIKLLEDIRDFKGFDPSVIVKGIRFDIEHLKDISHAAVVTDVGWIGPFTRAAGSFVRTEVRVFRRAEIDDARAWLRDAS